MARTETPVALVGIGTTPLSRQPLAPEVELAVDACRRAAADAGLEPTELDGINLQVHHYPPPPTGEVVARLDMKEVRWQVEGGVGVGPLARAAQALEQKAADVIVVCKIMNTVAPVTTPAIDPETGAVGGFAQFEVPYGLGYTMQRVGFMKRRWMHQHGISDAQVGWLCATQREHALLNPDAIWKTPLTVEQYLASRWIADPIHVLDCDYPVNGAYAYVLTRGDLAEHLLHEPVHLLSWTGGVEVPPSPHLLPEAGPGLAPDVRALYDDAGLVPGDMDVWMLYDGFSFLAMQWMEHLGLVEPGGSGEYVDGGERIRFDGEHPVNTHGGQLSEGRMHGAGHILEAVRQVRGEAGARQARRADRAVLSSAYPGGGAAAIVGRR